ncbi:Uncharacterised protein [Mycobacterium tuberculosis]|nr:Uncharacterised protein [Mycobacterium tuberculosis]
MRSTQALTGLPAAVSRAAPPRLAAASICTPSQAQSSSMRWRSGASFSPMPPVNTMASTPRKAPASMPMCCTTCSAKCAIASAAAGSAEACSARMSLDTPDSPSKPDSRNSSFSTASADMPRDRIR